MSKDICQDNIVITMLSDLIVEYKNCNHQKMGSEGFTIIHS